MPLNEVSFYNTNGDEVNISNIVNQMINYYDAKLEIGETAVTDFNEGSEIRNLLEAFAVGVYALLEEQHEATRIAFLQTSYGMWLDCIGELPFIDLPRVEGVASRGTVTFTLASVQETDYVIPAGTIVEDGVNGVEFSTVMDCTVLAGESSADVDVECLTTGLDGNVGSGTVTVIADAGVVDTDLVSVSNSEGFVGGEDYEEDEDYRGRLLDNVQSDGFGTIGYYTDLCTVCDGVHDVKFVADSSYTRKVLVNGYSKPTPDSVLADVLSELTLVDNIVLGHSFTVDKPAYTTVNLAVTLDVVTELDTDDLSDCLTAVFNGGGFDRMEYEGLNIDETLTREQIISELLVFADIVEVTSIKQSGVEITTLTPASNGVLKLGTVSFTQNEV